MLRRKDFAVRRSSDTGHVELNSEISNEDKVDELLAAFDRSVKKTIWLHEKMRILDKLNTALTDLLSNRDRANLIEEKKREIEKER